jgi:hypothetical protein
VKVYLIVSVRWESRVKAYRDGLVERPWLLRSPTTSLEPSPPSILPSPNLQTSNQHLKLLIARTYDTDPRRPHDLGLSEFFGFPVRAVPAVLG